MGEEIPIQKHGNYFVECDVMGEDGISVEQEKTKLPTKIELKYMKGVDKQAAKQGTLPENRPYRERCDWQFCKKEYRRWASQLGNEQGEFDVDLFTDGKGPVLGNSQCSKYYSLQDCAFLANWAGRFCYGNPVFEAEFIRRMLEKAEEDFQAAPENTRFMFVLPYWRSSSWWALTAPYKIMHVYGADERIYSAPTDQCYSPEALTDAGDSGGANRSFIQGAGFETVVLYRDKTSHLFV